MQQKNLPIVANVHKKFIDMCHNATYNKNIKSHKATKWRGGESLKSQEEKIVELMRHIKNTSPNDYFRLLGRMEGMVNATSVNNK